MSLMIKKLAGDSQTQSLASYIVLLKKVRQAIAQGKERALEAVEREAVRTKWETGYLILQHILLNQNRGTYGESVLKRLTKDLGISYTELKYCIEFARAYPKSPTSGFLTWSHYQELLAVNDSQKRDSLAAKANQERWNIKKIRAEAKPLKSSGVPKSNVRPTIDEVKPGTPGIYRIVEKEGKKYYDLGFYTYFEFKGRSPKVMEPPAQELYTYNAEVIDVYDGDTFHARIHLGFGVMQEMRVRLLRINAPEIISADGLKAKKVLQKILAKGNGQVLIQSKELDQHGRPLANVFTQQSSSRVNKKSLSSPHALSGDLAYESIDPDLLKSGVFTVRGQD